MKINLNLHCLATVLALAGACEQAGTDNVADWVTGLAVMNGDELNGTYFNGTYFNGTYFNGTYFNGIYLGGVYVNGVHFDGTSLIGSRSSDGATVQGVDFVGSKMKAVLSDATQIDLKINAVTHDAALNLDWYNVVLSLDGGATWGPLCAGGVSALVLAGRWSSGGNVIDDPNMFTFGCDNAALAKCRKWGYNPAASRQECDGQGHCKLQSLQAWHEACTRMVRADYCGNGLSHTRNGTPIDIYDNLGIQTRSGDLQMLEADWSADGAHCIRHTRYTLAGSPLIGESSDLQYVATVCPSRLAANDVSCGGDPNATGAMDLTDYPSAQGYNVSPFVRHLLRNDSNTGQ